MAGFALVKSVSLPYGGDHTGRSIPHVSCQCLAERKAPPSYLRVTLSSVAQEAVRLEHRGALLVHAQLVVHQDPPGLILQSHFPASHPSACSGAWGYSSLAANLRFQLLNLTTLIFQVIIATKKSTNLAL